MFAASSLTDAFNDIGKEFQAAYPGTKVVFNFGGSPALRTQLEQGAKADVFASANQAEMDKAKQSGVASGSDNVFAKNSLAVIVPKSNPAGIAAVRDLAKPNVRLVTAAPEVPVGVYTQDMLDKMSRDPAYGADFKQKVNANVVSREPNVRQVVAKVVLGEADAAVVYTTDVTPDVIPNIKFIYVPGPYNVLATYPIAVTNQPINVAGANVFVAFVLGPKGQEVLKKWGFLSPQ